MRGQRDGGNKLGLAGRPGIDGNSRSNMFGRERMSLYDIQVGIHVEESPIKQGICKH